MTVPHFQKKLEDLDDYEKRVIAQFSKWEPGAWKTVSEIDRGEFLYPYYSWFQHANGEFSDAEFILMKGDGPIEPTGSEIESAKPPYVDKIELDSLQLEYKKWYARLTKIRSLLRSEIQALQHDALRARGIFVPIEWGTL